MRQNEFRSCSQVVAINAARKFRNPAPILMNPTVRALLEDQKRARVLDVGGGCLRNAIHLQRRAFDVWVLEVAGIEQRFAEEYMRFRKAGGTVCYSMPREMFDLAIATFVIETICNPVLRNSLIRRVHERLRVGGRLILSSRGPRDLVTAIAKGERLSDGFITPGKSFSRSYTPSQLRRLLTSCGFSEIKFLHKPSTSEPELVHLIATKN